MINYAVVGFMFNPDKSKVALIRKERPPFQKGLLNGVGGKHNQGEHSVDAMCREFEEETGHKTYYYDWTPLVKLIIVGKEEWDIDIYQSKMESLDELKSTTDEKIEIIDVDKIENELTLSNLPWLIKMCLDKQFIYGEVKCK